MESQAVILLFTLTSTVVISLINNPADSYQRRFALVQFLPPEETCLINWVVESGRNCEWCEAMFTQLIYGLTQGYHPSSIHTEATTARSGNGSWNFDLKGTCSVNWFMAGDIEKLLDIFKSPKSKRFKLDDWFMYVKVDRKQDFLNSWRKFIDERNVRYFFPTTVLILVDTDHDHHVLNQGFETFPSSSTELTFSTMSTCYFCLDRVSYFIPYNKNINVWEILENSGDTKGYKAHISIECDFQWPLHNVLTLEATYFNSWTPYQEMLLRKYNALFLLGAAARHLNLTPYRFDASKRPYVRVFWVTTSNPFLRTQFTKVNAKMLTSTAQHLVYCRTTDLKKKANIFSDLFSPFDRCTWGILLVFLISMYIIPGFSLKNTIDLVWSILGQPPQGKKYGFLMVSIVILLIPMQSSYRDYFTTNAVIPFEEPYIDTNQEIFDSGYRVLCWSNDMPRCVSGYTYMLNSSEIKVKWDWNKIEQYVITYYSLRNYSVDSWKDLEFHVYITRGRDKVTAAEWRELARREIIRAERVPGTQCHMLKESWKEESHGIFYTDPLSQPLYDTFNRLTHAGIMEFWDSVFVSYMNRRTNILAVTNAKDTVEAEMESMNSSIESLLQIFLILHALNIMCFAAEIIFVKLATRWNSWKLKRKNRRAIWMLGKI